MHDACHATCGNTDSPSRHRPVHNDVASTDNMSASTSSPKEHICVICHNKFTRKQCRVFRIDKYDTSKQVVNDALSHMYIGNRGCDMICRTCYTHLHCSPVKQCTMPPSALASPLSGTVRCIVCQEAVAWKRAHLYKHSTYNWEHEKVHNILADISLHKDTIPHICSKCHASLVKYTYVTCVSCGNSVCRYRTRQVLQSHSPNEWVTDCAKDVQYVCKRKCRMADSEHCVSCGNMCKIQQLLDFSKSQYNVDNNVVHSRIGGINTLTDDRIHKICLKCHRLLKKHDAVTCALCHCMKQTYQTVSSNLTSMVIGVAL